MLASGRGSHMLLMDFLLNQAEELRRGLENDSRLLEGIFVLLGA